VRAQVGGLSEGFVDNRVERDNASDEVAPNRARFRLLRSGQQECASKLSGDFGRNRSELGGQPAPRATEIGSCKYDARADDTDADFACAGDGEHKDVVIRAADRAEFVARDDHSRIAGERRRVGCEVAQQRGQQAAPGAPERQPEEKAKSVLRNARRQHDDRHCADHCADYAEPALAQ